MTKGKSSQKGRRDFRKQILRPLTDKIRELLLREIQAGHVPPDIAAQIMPHGRYSRRAAWQTFSKYMDKFVKEQTR